MWSVKYWVFWVVLATTFVTAQPQQQSATPNSRQTEPSPDSQRAETLRKFLQENFSDSGRTLDYSSAFFDLNGDRILEAIVYLTSSGWCGSGGCDMLVLEPEGSSYKLITEISITRPPIVALKRSSHGWRHLAVFVAGGGILPGYEAELPFDGTKYAENPTVHPAERMTEKPDGDVLIGQ